MNNIRNEPAHDLEETPRLPAWIRFANAKTTENAAFLSGTALAHLHLVAGRGEVPLVLLRHRLAMQAAEACVAFSGRPERAGDLRDALLLRRPGDLPGPAGEICLQWCRAAERPVSVQALRRALPECDAAMIAGWRDAGRGAPVVRAAATLETVLADRPRDETAALILADAVLARALGWTHVLPLLARGLSRRDLRRTGDELRLVCHRALIASAAEAARMAADLSRRAARLRTVAPKLRARGGAAAVGMFLDRDAVTPAALADPVSGVGMSGRAARRLCDRLVALGALRELTGRDTFRLYGV